MRRNEQDEAFMTLIMHAEKVRTKNFILPFLNLFVCVTIYINDNDMKNETTINRSKKQREGNISLLQAIEHVAALSKDSKMHTIASDSDLQDGESALSKPLAGQSHPMIQNN